MFVCHNEIYYIIADLEWLNKVCHDVAIEPPLQQLTGMANVPATANWQDEAYSDIHARGYGGDIRVLFLMAGFSPK